MANVERQAGSTRKAGQNKSSWSNRLQAKLPITGATYRRDQLPCFWQWPYEGKRTDASAPLTADTHDRWDQSDGHCLTERVFGRMNFMKCAAAPGPAKDSLPKPKTLSAITTAVPSSDQLLSGGSTTSLHLAETIPPV